jgi:AcrR family transcriptional regulator
MDEIKPRIHDQPAIDGKTQKAEETRKRILEAALRLFMEEGYEKATMRRIAQDAGLTPGATYYHFPSKENIVFHFYESSFADHVAAVDRILETERGLRERLSGVIAAHLKVAEPFHSISKALYRTAADPAHPLSPFSAESKSLRDKNIGIFARALEGHTSGLTKPVREKLPELLWLYKMGVILFWLYDDSPEQAKTYRFLDQTSDILVKIIRLSKVPGVGSFANRLVKLVDDFKPWKE